MPKLGKKRIAGRTRSAETRADGQVAPQPFSLALFRRRLLAWFRRHARELPWRQSTDAYRVWVSEIMLQQTQVETVKPYFARFVARFPTVATLAAAPEQEVLRHWEGLGYYRRARQLHRAAQQMVAEHDGEFPSDPEAVRRLPGIGRYTAGAILSIAFDQRQPIVEANTIRLYARLLGFDGDPFSSAGQQLLWSFAADILPAKSPGEFNQALMELGSLICTPRTPNCEACPALGLCPTQRSGLQSQIPRPKKKPVFEELREVAVVVRRQRQLLLRQCAAGERWAGLWDFPRFPYAAADDHVPAQVQSLTGVRIGVATQVATLKHGVTRYKITLECLTAPAVGGRLLRGQAVRWVTLDELEHYPLSTTGRKICQLVRSTL